MEIGGFDQTLELVDLNLGGRIIQIYFHLDGFLKSIQVVDDQLQITQIGRPEYSKQILVDIFNTTRVVGITEYPAFPIERFDLILIK